MTGPDTLPAFLSKFVYPTKCSLLPHFLLFDLNKAQECSAKNGLVCWFAGGELRVLDSKATASGVLVWINDGLSLPPMVRFSTMERA